MEEWYYTSNGERVGPVRADKLKALASSGSLGPDDLVWKQGMNGWIKASRVKGLLPITPQADAAPPILPAIDVSVLRPPSPNNSGDVLPNKGINPLVAAAASFFCTPLGHILLGQTRKGVFILIAAVLGLCACCVGSTVVVILGLIDSYTVAKAVEMGQQVGVNEYRVELLYKIMRFLDKTATYRP